jgi:hypothetical protein
VPSAPPVYAARVRLLPLAILPLVLCACAGSGARQPSGGERAAIVAAIDRDWQTFASELAVLQDQNLGHVQRPVPYLDLLPHVAAVRVAGSGARVASAAVDLRDAAGRVRLPQAIVLLEHVGGGWYWALGGMTTFPQACVPGVDRTLRRLVCPSPWKVLGLPSRAPRAGPGVTVPLGVADVHTVDWRNVPVPGAACGATAPIPIRNGGAFISSPSEPWWPVVQVVAESPVFVDLNGDGHDEAVVRVVCSNGGGSADGQLGFADVVYSATGGKLRTIAVLTPRQPLSLASGHVPLLGRLDAGPGRLVENEAWYGFHDSTCCPTGRETTTWLYANGRLRPVRTVITREPAG